MSHSITSRRARQSPTSFWLRSDGFAALFVITLTALFGMMLNSPAYGQTACDFPFEQSLVESSANQALVVGEDGRRVRTTGNWAPIYSRSETNRVRRFARTIGRLDLCWEKDGEKPIFTYCTASLLAGNRILTNSHCTNASDIRKTAGAGWFLAEARLVMGFDDSSDTSTVKSYSVPLRALAFSSDADAQILKVRGNPNATWGATSLVFAGEAAADGDLMLIHHPGAISLQFNPKSCKIHSSQDKADYPQIRHTCDTFFGSSGALLLRESDLAIVALHFAGGLRPGDIRSFNKAVAFDFVAQKLGLETIEATGNGQVVVPTNLCQTASQFWTLIQNTTDIGTLNNFIDQYGDCPQAGEAREYKSELAAGLNKKANEAGNIEKRANAIPTAEQKQEEKPDVVSGTVHYSFGTTESERQLFDLWERCSNGDVRSCRTACLSGDHRLKDLTCSTALRGLSWQCFDTGDPQICQKACDQGHAPEYFTCAIARGEAVDLTWTDTRTGEQGSGDSSTLLSVRMREQLTCGVSTGRLGFSKHDSIEDWHGFDVDYCRALAAAIFGDVGRVEFVPLSAKARFIALQSGEVDVLNRHTMYTPGRDEMGIDYVGPTFIDGLAMMVRKDLGVTTTLELSGATVCLMPGTMTELAIDDYFRAKSMEYEPFNIMSASEASEAYDAGRCDVLADDWTSLARSRLDLAMPDDHHILPELLNADFDLEAWRRSMGDNLPSSLSVRWYQLGPFVREGDPRWLKITRLVRDALLTAESAGFDKDSAATANGSEHVDIPALSRISSAGKELGLSSDWLRMTIAAAGHYGEIYERNLGLHTPMELDRRHNRLKSEDPNGLLTLTIAAAPD